MGKRILCIKGWYGRLGNNIIQIKHAIQIALYCGYDGIVFPRHMYFKTCVINMSDNMDNVIDEYIYGDDCNQFYNDDQVGYVNPKCFSMNYERVREILLDIFVVDYAKLEPLEDNALVIHIRSGDAINVIHPQYVIPPMSYYTKEIESGKYGKIYIMAEDKLNPCIEKLCNMYSNVVNFELRDLKDDIELVLRARNVMMTVGTFIPSLLWVTKYTREVIYPSYEVFCRHMIPLNRISGELHLRSINMEEYYRSVDKNETPEKRMSRVMIL